MEHETNDYGLVLEYALENDDLSQRLTIAEQFAQKRDPQNLGHAIETLQDALGDVHLPPKVYDALESHINDLRKEYTSRVKLEALNHYNNSVF